MDKSIPQCQAQSWAGDYREDKQGSAQTPSLQGP
jgi:hypothetical protein